MASHTYDNHQSLELRVGCKLPWSKNISISTKERHTCENLHQYRSDCFHFYAVLLFSAGLGRKLIGTLPGVIMTELSRWQGATGLASTTSTSSLGSGNALFHRQNILFSHSGPSTRPWRWPRRLTSTTLTHWWPTLEELWAFSLESASCRSGMCLWICWPSYLSFACDERDSKEIKLGWKNDKIETKLFK